VNMIPLQPIKPPAITGITLNVELPTETAALINKFVALNQHTRATHGPMSWERLVQMLLEDVAASVRDGNSWRGAHMAQVLHEYGYRT
jgi:hypothetical protein